MINKYWGLTNSILGATYFNVGSILNVQEGYDTGNTIEYNDLGDFEILDLNNNGAFNQSLNINASRKIKRLAYNNLFLPRELKRHDSYFESFDDPSALESRWIDTANSATTYGITQGKLRASYGSGSVGILTYADRNDYADIRVIWEITMGVTNHSNGILFRSPDTADATESGYLMQYARGTRTLDLYWGVNNTFTLITSAAATVPPANTSFTYMLLAYGPRIMGFQLQTTNTGEPFTKLIDVLDSHFARGAIALRAGGVSTVVTYEYVDIVEIGNRYTNEDVLRKVGSMGEVDNIDFQKDLNGVSGWAASSGSTFTIGNTNGYQQVGGYNVGAGNSWHTLIGLSWANSDFVLECEVSGSSGNFAGILVGNTSTWYGNYHSFVNLNQSIDNYINARFTYRSRGDYITLQDNTWYKFKVIKENNFISWYINDTLVNSIYGVSLSNLDSASPGLFTYRGGVSGKFVYWKNVRVSWFDDVQDSISVDVNSPLEATFDRLVPPGTIINQSGSTTNIYRLGISNANLGYYGITNLIINSNESKSYIENSRHVYVRGDNAVALQYRDTSLLNHYKVSFINDQRVKTGLDATYQAYDYLIEENRNIYSINIEINPYTSMEQWDNIFILDNTLGVSMMLVVGNMHKTWESTSGRFTMDVNLFPDWYNLLP